MSEAVFNESPQALHDCGAHKSPRRMSVQNHALLGVWHALLWHWDALGCVCVVGEAHRLNCPACNFPFP